MSDDLPSSDELARLAARLEQIAEDRTVLDSVSEALRVRVLRAAGLVSRPERDQIRAGRRERLMKQRANKRKKDVALFDTTRIRSTLRLPVYTAPSEEPIELRPERLEDARACYACKAAFREVHVFYDALCPSCAALNYEMRFPRGDLSGRVAIVTGARLKIGYQTALLLLRAGARVVATTRFPHDAAQRFSAEKDFASFADRLHVYGLDLRHTPSVELFAAQLSARHPHLDILVNNAAQTVRRPAAFYRHLLALEAQPQDELPAASRALLADHHALLRELRGHAGTSTIPAEARGLVGFRGQRAGLGLTDSAQLSQLPCGDEEADHGRVGSLAEAQALFPDGRLDVDLQQVDLRTHNSWRMRAGDVPPGELLEVHLVNAIAPFVLCAGLRPMLERSPHAARFIVNVSAMEAQFSRNKKTDRHPHTNMAKAALNMLTRTSAADYARSRIYMNSVDTGWVTDEDPLQHVTRKQAVHDFHPPLDIVDGAARVVAPVFTSLSSAAPPYGVFFKDYRAVTW